MDERDLLRESFHRLLGNDKALAGQLDKLKSPHEVFSSRASLIFKSTQVTRFWDAKRKALVYLVYTDRIIEGSPRNSISVVPVGLQPK